MNLVKQSFWNYVTIIYLVKILIFYVYVRYALNNVDFAIPS